MARPRDFYADLGVARTASQEEVQRAYRKLARAFHPDVNKSPDAEERFKDVSEAYSVLSDPEQRRRYAWACGVHPELVHRLVALGLIEPDRDVHGALWFSPAQVAEVSRIRRLRSAFALNYASVGLVCDLLDRIAALESVMRHRSRPPGDRSWT